MYKSEKLKPNSDARSESRPKHRERKFKYFLLAHILTLFFVVGNFSFAADLPAEEADKSFDSGQKNAYSEPFSKLIEFLKDKKEELENYDGNFIEAKVFLNNNNSNLSALPRRQAGDEAGDANYAAEFNPNISSFLASVLGSVKDTMKNVFDSAKSFVFIGDNQNSFEYTSPTSEENAKEIEILKQQYEDAIDETNAISQKFNLLQTELGKIKNSGAVAMQPSAGQKDIENTIKILEMIVSGLPDGQSRASGFSQNDFDSKISEIRLELNNLNTNLLNKINNLSVQASDQTSAVYHTVSLTNKIDSLSGTRLSNITVSGVTGLTDADIPDTITASSYLPLSGGTLTGALTGAALTLSGQLTVSGAATSTLAGDTNFDSGTLYIDSVNNRVGIASSSPSETLSVNGAAYFSQISAPSVTTDRLYNSSGDLYWNGNLVGSASVGNWTSLAGNVYRSSGNVGIGTTSPYARLSVAGETVSSYFTATTTTASTFPYASSTALTVSGSAYLTGLGQGWLHTAGGTNALSASTSPTVNYLTATSTTATSTFAGGMSVAGTSGLTVLQSGNVGIGTTTPSAKLDVSAGNVDLDNTTNANQFGVISKNGTRFIHNFNYGNNGTVTTDGYNTFVGENAGNLTMGSTATAASEGSYNTAIGNGALQANTTGFYNTANGYASLYYNTTGNHNTANGRQALYNNTTGYYNTASGYGSLDSNTTGYNNTASGMQSLRLNTTGTGNTANGYASLYYNTTGANNTAIGNTSLHDLDILDGTGNNTVIGYNAGRGIVTGINNTIIGANVTGLSSTLSNNIIIADGSGNRRINVDSNGNIGIGTTSPYALLSISNNLNTPANTPLFTIASTTAGTATSTLLTVLANGKTGIGTNNPQQKLHVYRSDDRAPVRFEDSNGYCEIDPTSTSWTCTSDRTLKKDITNLSSANSLSKLSQLQAVNFKWLNQDNSDLRYGFVAQDVETILPDFVRTDEKGIKSVNYGGFTPLMIDAIKELNLKVSDLQASVSASSLPAGEAGGTGSDGLFAWILNKFNAIGITFGQDKIGAKNLCAKKSDGSEVCVDGDQLQSLLDKNGITQSSSSSSSVSSSSSSESSQSSSSSSVASSSSESSSSSSSETASSASSEASSAESSSSSSSSE